MLGLFHSHGGEVFMQDNAPCHKIKNYLQQKQIKILKWPGNCPDLNRMENCWQKIKYLLKQKKTPNLDTLKNQLKKVWCQEVRLDYF